MAMRRFVCAALCLAAAGCGSASPASPPPSPSPSPAPGVVQLGMRHNRFVPARVVVRLGQTVRWTNRDQTTHTVASQDLRLASEGIGPGATYTYRPRRRGRFRYFCTIHAGQTGVLIVR
jgi:plastocyanin